MKSKVVFVILNYLNYEDTIECVECALKQTYRNFEIIIVENGSPNHSFHNLKICFGENPQITILKSKENLGFAKGINIGIRYARKELKADYVFVGNSDLIFHEDLLETLMEVDDKGVGVISPVVYTMDGKRQPMTVSTDHIYKLIMITIWNMIVEWLMIIQPFYSIKEYIKKSWNRIWKSKKNNCNNYDNNYKDFNYKFMLQGCSYLLTPQFFQYYKQLYPKTFLYWEEINLMVYLNKVNLMTKISHNSLVFHKEKQSVKRVFSSYEFNRKKLLCSTTSLFASMPMFILNYSTIKKRYSK